MAGASGTRSTLRGALVAALAVGLLAVPLAAATAPPDPTKLVVTGLGKPVQGTLGYHCLPDGNGSGQCTNPGPVKPTGIVKLRPNARATMLLGAPATYARWAIGRPGPDGKPRLLASGQAYATTKSGKRWRFQLPAKIGRATFAAFEAYYVDAYASWETGARVQRH
jgi:hypothetical protein